MNEVSKVLSISFVINFMLSIAKIVFGFIGKSSALIADGMHSFSDLVTDIIGIIGAIFSKKPSDNKHPYGHGKAEYLISIFIGIVIILIGFIIIYNSIKRKTFMPSLVIVVVSSITIIIKFILARYIIKKGYELKNNILISSGRESNMDVISSVVVLLSAILMHINISIFKYSDIIAGILVGLFILKVGFNVLKENISTILGEQETDTEYLTSIAKIILSEEDIIEISSLIVLKYGPYYKLISELSLNKNLLVEDAYHIVEKVKKKISKQFKDIDFINITIIPFTKNI